MSFSPNSTIVRRTIDLNYANKKRSSSLKWSAVNAVFLVIFIYDLSCKCEGYTSVLHYVEAICAGVLVANLLQHAICLLRRTGDDVVTLTQKQQKILGLADTDLDSSFRLIDTSINRIQVSDAEKSFMDTSADDLSVSLSISMRRSWRSGAGGDSSPPSPASPSSSPPSRMSASPPSPRQDRQGKDEFISDHNSLNDYLKQYEERSRLEPCVNPSAGPSWGSWGMWGVWGTSALPTSAVPHYQLAALDTDSSKLEEGSGQGSPHVWWRLDLDPQRLTQFNLNLRLWIHVTILERLVREMDVIDETLAKQGLTDVKIGEVSIERLRKLGASGHVASLPTLLPFLEPFPDQRYLVRRIRELAVGGCLSNYKWNGGSSDWDDTKPTDSEILLHLLSTYIDGQAPGGGAGNMGGTGQPFTSTHISMAPAPIQRSKDALVIHRVTKLPPHYVLILGEETIEIARGRNNLIHTILLFLAAAARREPPALRRLHLGPAALNMLWIIGR